MKKLILFIFISFCMTTIAVAEEATEMAEEATDAATEMEAPATGGSFLDQSYIVLKYVSIQSGEYDHSGKTITGEAGSGVAVDFGYLLNDHMAVELAMFSGGNDVEEPAAAEGESHNILGLAASDSVVAGTAAYTAVGLNFVMLHHYNNGLSSVAKVGYVSETETLDFEGVSSSATNGGLAVILGAEYKLGGHNEVVFEIEKAFIEGPKGLNILVGWKIGLGH